MNWHRAGTEWFWDISHVEKRLRDLSNAGMSICETTRWQNPLVSPQKCNFPADLLEEVEVISWPYPRSSTWQASPGMVQERTWIALAYASCDAEAGRIEMVLNGGCEACNTYHLPCLSFCHWHRPCSSTNKNPFHTNKGHLENRWTTDRLLGFQVCNARVDGWPAKLQQICHGHVLLPFVRRSFGLFL